MMRDGRSIPFLSALLGTLLLLAGGARHAAAADTAGLVGKDAPMFSTIDLDGKPVRFSEILPASSLVVLNFWGVRCASCLEEMPYLSGIHGRYASKRVRVLGVNVDGMDPDKLKGLLPQVAAVPPYTLVVDPDFKISDMYGLSAAPLTLLVLPGGKVVYQHEGFTAGDEKRLEEEIAKFLKGDTAGK